MHRHRFARLAPLGAALMLVCILPASMAAQAARRTAPDQPSKNRETLVQHDSLAVRFLRAPKVKPAARETSRPTGPASAKFRGRAAPIESARPAETPLPTKKAGAKR